MFRPSTFTSVLNYLPFIVFYTGRLMITDYTNLLMKGTFIIKKVVKLTS
jgi:hypothetical protein